jgi:DNA polymerase-3 subunit alpha
MDFLGLSNLTIINDALRIIRRLDGHTIDLATLPLDDAETYKLLSRGDTTGVFQLESAGMKKYLRQLKPTTFDDIIAMVALYRPGPMQFIDDFIERKHGRRKVVYEHAGMEEALSNTYGILVYQEQFMQISKDMCGFTGGQADTLRKAIGKKQRETMAKMRVAFIDGMVETSGVTKDFAETFCFNKSHSACYALIAYQTAYLKAHYPAAYMAALMTSDFGNIDRIAIEVAEVQRMGLKVLPPDVNESFREFAVVKESGNIRFGLSAIKNVGSGAIEAILRAREEGGVFTSVEDFAKRVSASECNKKGWESLIRCGAFDSLVPDRGQLLHNLDSIVSYAQRAQKNALSGQIDIFGSLGAEENLPQLRFDPPEVPPTSREMLSWEKELLGLYLSHHPLDDYANYLDGTTQPLASITSEHDGRLARVGGMIVQSRRITTKKGDMMAFATIEDRSGGSIELIVFPKAYEKAPELWSNDKIIWVSGKISGRDREGRPTDELQIMVDAGQEVNYEEAKSYKLSVPKIRDKVAPAPAPTPIPETVVAERLVISLPDLSDQETLMKIRDLLKAVKGKSEAYLVVGGEGAVKRIRLPFMVEVSESLVDRLNKLVGEGAVSTIAV